MKKQHRILALIPARSGSKGISNKNIVDLGGHPLLAYSIAVAKLSKHINRIVVTTDDQKIAALSKRYSAEVPFLRPKKISGDRSLDREFFLHALGWLKEHQKYLPDLIVHLRPSTPLRQAEVIDRAIEEVLRDKKATALRSGEIFTAELPYKLFKKEKGYCNFFGKEDFCFREEYYNYPRQNFPPIYRPNGYVDIILPKILLKTGLLHGKSIKAFITEKVVDIDKLSDLAEAQKIYKNKCYKPLLGVLGREYREKNKRTF